MQFTKLSRQDFEKAPKPKKDNPALGFVKSLRVGEGGHITVEQAGVGRQTIKARIKNAAAELGRKVKFHRSPADEVKFEIVG